MLEKIREGSQGIVAKSILGLVILTFALSGVYSYLGSSSTPAAATVNGEEISQQQLQNRYENERARMEQQLGELFSQLASDENYINNMRDGILDGLIADELTSQSSADLSLRVSTKQIKDAIRAMPEFQTDGQFDNERYLATLAQVGFTPSSFRDYMRNEMTRRQLTAALVLSEFSLSSEAAEFNKLQNQTRDIRYLEVNAEQFLAQVEPTEEQIQEYYQTNLTQFDTQEKVALSYIHLSAEKLAENISVTDEEIEQYYQDSLDSYRQEERRRVSHILIESGDDEAAAEQQAQALLDQINGGADFAELAQANSADSFSAENGGDLDWMEAGVMEEAFDNAAFALANINDVSALVKTSFGFHIIKLTDIEAEQTKPLAEVKEEITLALKRDQASSQFYEVQTRLAELVFEIPDTLQDAAEETGLAVLSTELFERAQAPLMLSHPAVLAQAFSSELIEDQINSDVIEIGAEELVVIRVAEHQPVRTQQLDEVKAEVVAALRQQQATDMAKTLADKLLATITSAVEVDALLAENNLSWIEKEKVVRNDAELDGALTRELFKLANKGEEVSAGVVATAQGYALIQLMAVKAGEEGAPTERMAVQQRLSNGATRRLMTQFVEALKAQADIQKS